MPVNTLMSAAVSGLQTAQTALTIMAILLSGRPRSPPALEARPHAKFGLIG